MKRPIIILSLVIGLALMLSGPVLAGSVYYFPQIAAGQSGSVILSTHFTLSSTSAYDTTVTMRFYNSSGSPWSLNLLSYDRPDADGLRSSTTFVLEPLETASFFTQGAAALAAGWARVESNRPLLLSAGYTALDGSISPVKPLWEAGVLPASCSTIFRFEANVSPNDNFSGVDVDTAFAIVNPGSRDANVTVTLQNSAGKSVGTAKYMFLTGGDHQSRYLSELFGDYAFSGRFHGTVNFSSNVNVAILALRQSSGMNGTVLSTITCLPAGELKRQVVAEFEPNDTIADARDLTLPAEVTGTANSSSDGQDTDFYQFILTAGDRVSVALLGEIIGSPLNAQLFLYRTDHTQVASSDDSDGMVDPHLTYVAGSTGYYYLSVRSTDGTHGRDAFYKLLVLKR